MHITEALPVILLSLIEIALVSAGVWFVAQRLEAMYSDRPDQQFRKQMILVAIVLVAILTIILILPVSPATRGSLMSLFGIVLSATIALSSTNLVGNIMAGIMLRTVGSFKLGDYIHVGEFFGRVSEMDLLHTEIQTEERDLTTLPNSYLAAHPVRVMRTSGSILSVELSLGYDVSRHTIERLLLEAAKSCELESPFVQIRHLGDYSITYAIAGLLTDVKSLLGKRRALRAATIDVLHANGIEIASPVLASTRNFKTNHQFLANEAAPQSNGDDGGDAVTPDSLVFDKALQAEGLDKLRERREVLIKQIGELKLTVPDGAEEGTESQPAMQESLQRAERRLARLDEVIARREAEIANSE
ncbi:MAG: mechanosensitive ion channel family protein [Pseudomonadota bacterium]